MKSKIKNIHFVGIGGIGMSGIAEILHNLEYTVTGSDIQANTNSQRLQSLGIGVAIGHDARNVDNVDVVVVSSAINEANPEVQCALVKGIPIVPRAMMLAELMRFKHGIAIAGAHGKTTTTSLCAEVLNQCGLDPTFIIGGALAATKCNAKIGAGQYLVAEADESDASFLQLHPMIAVITNIDYDHMQTYDHSQERLLQTFVQFVHNLPFYGKAVLCKDDPLVQKIMPQIKRSIITYGLDDSSDVYASAITARGSQMHFTLHIPFLQLSEKIVLNSPGVHNVLNALAAIVVALECNGTMANIKQALAQFHGVGRRCQHYGTLHYQDKTVQIIDDYAHHPTEIKATVTALSNAYPDKRLLVVFQPHRYTRTRDLFNEFVTILANIKVLILIETYAAGESPIINATTEQLLQHLKQKHIQMLKCQLDSVGQQGYVVVYAKDLNEAKAQVLALLNDNDIIVTMGAGSINKLPSMLLNSDT